MPAPLPVATVLDNVDPGLNVPTAPHGPSPFGVIGKVLKTTGGRPVLAMGKFVSTMGDFIGLHGNPAFIKIPGYNPLCAVGKSFIKLNVSTSVLVNGRPVAKIGSICSCTHVLVGPGAPTVLVGR